MATSEQLFDKVTETVWFHLEARYRHRLDIEQACQRRATAAEIGAMESVMDTFTAEYRGALSVLCSAVQIMRPGTRQSVRWFVLDWARRNDKEIPEGILRGEP